MNRFTFFNRRERIGTLLLCLLLLAAAVRTSSGSGDARGQAELIAAERDSLLLFLAQTEDRAEGRTERTAFRKEKETEYFPFDPNRADSSDFISLGLPSWMVRNILRYRAKGGKFRQPEDFRKIYGLKEQDYRRLLPYIYVEVPGRVPAKKSPSLLRDTLKFPKAEKYAEGTVVELNSADTSALKKIPGIGPFTARRIVAYRRRLGGYCSVRQLEDISLDSDSLGRWFSTDTALIRKIAINSASIHQLRRHPYINFYQARAFIEFRRRKGAIRHLKSFRLYEEFPEGSLQRLLPYISFATEGVRQARAEKSQGLPSQTAAEGATAPSIR